MVISMLGEGSPHTMNSELPEREETTTAVLRLQPGVGQVTELPQSLELTSVKLHSC